MNVVSNKYYPQMVVDQYADYSVIRYTVNTSWKEHSYLLVDHATNEAVLIDPGYDIEDLLKHIVLQGWSVKFVLATHAHFDHVAGVADVERQFSQRCIIHPKEKRLFLHAPMYSLRFGGVTMKRPQNVAVLDEALESQLEAFGISVLWTPGHTQGGMTFFYHEIAFTGDTLLKGYVGRTDLPDSDEEKIVHSVDTIIEELQQRNIRVVYPGHGSKWNAEEAKDWWNAKRDAAPHLDCFID